jgi:hypothetical protein
VSGALAPLTILGRDLLRINGIPQDLAAARRCPVRGGRVALAVSSGASLAVM